MLCYWEERSIRYGRVSLYTLTASSQVTNYSTVIYAGVISSKHQRYL
jgi:hypothetical protein